MLLFARNDAHLNEGDPLAFVMLALVLLVVLNLREGETREEFVGVEALFPGCQT